MGFRIFAHALQLVLSNLGPALNISALLYFLPVVASQIIVPPLLELNDPAALLRSPWVLVVLLVSIAASMWVAVAWHRYVLLDEMPGAFAPPLRLGRLLPYFGRSLLLGMIGGVLGGLLYVAVAFLSILLLAARANPALISLAFIAVAFIGLFAIAIIAYRLSITLAASAVERPISLGEAWAATRGANGTIGLLALLSLLAIAVVAVVTSALDAYVGVWAGALWQLFASWIQLLAGVSIITTLYGYYVEKRPIG
ncbi:MAG: hypothetical protein EOP22_16485 [Hyphomicrobiales bacterium]|nr:MAG: hypothetical protein EOP22_16485 [Hyphomicrobiales bacterium]